MNEEKYQDLIKLINQIEKASNQRSLSNEYLEENGHQTREELSVGEYAYGVVMVPEDFVLPFLKELVSYYENNNNHIPDNRKMDNNNLKKKLDLLNHNIDDQDYFLRLAKKESDVYGYDNKNYIKGLEERIELYNEIIDDVKSRNVDLIDIRNIKNYGE